MLFVSLLALAIICLLDIETASGKNKIFDDYMSKQRTTSIKGVFAIIIVLSHMLQYVRPNGVYDTAARNIIVWIGQLMVTMFFFYSGYGIIESHRDKPDYAKHFFKNRFLKTLVHFDMAIILFIIVNACIGKEYELGRTLTAFTGWTSVGNSNWFIFTTLVLYLLTLPMLCIFKKRQWAVVLSVTLLTIGFIIFLRNEKDSWWYNTLLCYPLGMLWSVARGRIEDAFRHNIWLWWLAVATSAVAMAVPTVSVYKLLRFADYQTIYMVQACFFCMFVVLTQMRLKVSNSILYWLGFNSFSIYILQRLPMNIFKYFGINGEPSAFIPLALAATLVIAPLFTKLTGWVDKLLFSSPQKEKVMQKKKASAK